MTKEEYQKELNRVDYILKTTQSSKLKRDTLKYKKRIQKELRQFGKEGK